MKISLILYLVLQYLHYSHPFKIIDVRPEKQTNKHFHFLFIVESKTPKINALDIDQLRQQYKKLKQRSKQVQIIIQCKSIAFQQSFQYIFSTLKASNKQRQHFSESVCSITAGPLVRENL